MVIRSSGYNNVPTYTCTRRTYVLIAQHKRKKRNRTHIFMPENSVRIHKKQILFPSLSFSRLLSFRCYFFVEVRPHLLKPLPAHSDITLYHSPVSAVPTFRSAHVVVAYRRRQRPFTPKIMARVLKL